MGKKKTNSKRKSELRIIFFIILAAAAIFIISTYAWFTTQKNVSITNLNGMVEVAEGLEISLDGDKWQNEIVLGDGEGQMDIIEDAYYTDDGNHRNITPKEMLPVSTTGILNKTDLVDVEMLRGRVTNSTTTKLDQIVAMNEGLALEPDTTKHDSGNAKYPGYFAFDIFLKNTSKITEDNEKTGDPLQLNYDSSVQIITGGNEDVGLQNTVRVALARYGSTYDASSATWKGVADVIDKQDAVLNKTGATNKNASKVYLTDVAIWEPNSSDHVDHIVEHNNKLIWPKGGEYGTKDEVTGRYKFANDTKMPTYALKEGAKNVTEITDIYNWDGTANSATLQKQNALQTTSTKEDGAIKDYTISEGVQNLISASDGTTTFAIAPNQISRLRVYVWLEGQDVDCINYASFGGGITVNLGLVKGSTPGTHEGSVQPENT